MNFFEEREKKGEEKRERERCQRHYISVILSPALIMSERVEGK